MNDRGGQEPWLFIKENLFSNSDNPLTILLTTLGSMLPKVKAAVDFVQSKENRTAIVTSLETAKRAIQGKTGTTIYR